MSLIASAYLDKTFSERDEASLAFLSSLVCGTQAFDERHAVYGLPPPLFLFVEDLLWFAQAWRSGSWTYFEATPPERQQAMLEALRTDAPNGWSDQYASGMRRWQEAEPASRPRCVDDATRSGQFRIPLGPSGAASGDH